MQGPFGHFVGIFHRRSVFLDVRDQATLGRTMIARQGGIDRIVRVRQDNPLPLKDLNLRAVRNCRS